MSPDTITTFLSGYLHSLREVTRDEKTGSKYGFDHIILKLAEAEEWTPLRLAFHRGGRDSAPKPKTEREHGEDFKAISKDGSTLIIFVLKDEPLTYANWIAERFEWDLRRAAAQDLSATEFSSVKSVRVILAYNKDEDANGVESYERTTRSLGTKVGDTAQLTFERWNLTELTNRVRDKLIGSPALLPEKLFKAFSYICWQVEDFTHGSEQWTEVLIPDWREFLASVLKDPISEKEVRMISVALIILNGHGKDEPAWETGWIELIEWAMLALWSAYRRSRNEKVTSAILGMWINVYLHELEIYYERNAALLCTADSLACGFQNEFAEAISSHHAYWHMARLGILAASFEELSDLFHNAGAHAELEAIQKSFQTVLNTWIGMMNANPSCHRPILDCHHLQLFLLWRALSRAGRRKEVTIIIGSIFERLMLRRLGYGGVRLIDQSNSWPLLLEYIATGVEPSESFGKSSYLIQMLLEICVGDLGEDGAALAEVIYRQLVAGKMESGEAIKFKERVELQSWVPPLDWIEKVLDGNIGNTGICITLNPYYGLPEDPDESLVAKICSLVTEMRAHHPMPIVPGMPLGAILLACLVHKSPVPPELWRLRCGEFVSEQVATNRKPKQKMKAAAKRRRST